MTKEQEYKYFKDYCQAKYGSAYLSAIAKLNAPYSEAYDEKGYLKPDYCLTSLEREAILMDIPEIIKETDYNSSIRR